MRVVLTGNRRRTRSALKQLLDQEPELNVVGTVASTRALITQVQQKRPDLVLLDWELPGARAADMLSALRAMGGDVKVVAFSAEQESRWEALSAGADAFVSREAPWEWLLMTLRSVGGLSPCFAG
jgi:DNA-binding NarL/FixJ family response regulator